MRDTLEYLISVLLVEGLGADGTISEDELERLHQRAFPRMGSDLGFNPQAVKDAFDVYYEEDYHDISEEELNDLVDEAVDVLRKEFKQEELYKFISIIKASTDFNLFSSANKKYLNFLKERWQL